MTLVFIEGLFVLTGMMHNAVGLLALTDVAFPAPVYCGDTVHGVIQVQETRYTKASGRGLIRCSHLGVRQDGIEVIRYSSVRLIRSDPSRVQNPVNEPRQVN